MKAIIPNCVKKYFWGDDLAQLSWEKHKKYIIKTLLNDGDRKSVSWLFTKINKSALKKQLKIIELDSKSANFWSKYFS